MTRHLPPFGPLVAFDSVARNLSFTKAADELGVTQSAISHQIRRLEDFFGSQLLKRLNPGVILTDHGAKLYAELVPLLDGIVGLESSLHRQSGKKRLRLGAGSSLAAWWLIRRLRSFRALHPEIEIEFTPLEIESASKTPLDVRIFWTTQTDSHASALQAPLFRENIFPVCAPSLLPDGKPLENPADLIDLPLIQKGHTPMGEWSWAFWFRKLGLNSVEPRDLVLGDMGLCLTAAVDGAGVAIGRSLLVADAIADGRLVPALASSLDVLSTKVHVARWNEELVGDRNTQVLVKWLAQAARETCNTSLRLGPL
jgi:LysR family transcriptional regulator, glycine cleavage system transcriptional activator